MSRKPSPHISSWVEVSSSLKRSLEVAGDHRLLPDLDTVRLFLPVEDRGEVLPYEVAQPSEVLREPDLLAEVHSLLDDIVVEHVEAVVVPQDVQAAPVAVPELVLELRVVVLDLLQLVGLLVLGFAELLDFY